MPRPLVVITDFIHPPLGHEERILGDLADVTALNAFSEEALVGRIEQADAKLAATERPGAWISGVTSGAGVAIGGAAMAAVGHDDGLAQSQLVAYADRLPHGLVDACAAAASRAARGGALHAALGLASSAASGGCGNGLPARRRL